MDGGNSNKTTVRFFVESATNDVKKASLVFFLPTSEIDLSVSIT